MDRPFFVHIFLGFTVAIVVFYVHIVQSFRYPRNVWSEGRSCYKSYGMEPNYDDHDCSTYYVCHDYWGSLRYCPSGYQFHFDHEDCREDEEVLCQWQLEYHHTYGSDSSDSDTSSHQRSCHIDYGLEPNHYDYKCKSYYTCKDHWGTLGYCPSGYQFDFEHIDCRKDEDVLCKWQLEYYGDSHVSSGSSSGSSSRSRMPRSVSPKFGVSKRAASAAYYSNDYSEGHICHVSHGFEPNFEDSEECATYWSCEDHWGTLQRCHGSDQFHFQYGMCMNDDDVSCWVQMEKYYHGFSYSSDSGSSDSYSKTKTCDISQGQEPNYYDEGCKSYWYCQDHHGVLHDCPEGFQFDWDKLDCEKDEEVICEKQMEYFYEHIYYHEVHQDEGSSFQIESGHHLERTESEFKSNTDLLSPNNNNKKNNNNNFHRCDIEKGRQADFASKSCKTYWQCSGYFGTRQVCPEGYQFHWEQRECLKDVYVDCTEQRDYFPHFDGGSH